MDTVAAEKQDLRGQIEAKQQQIEQLQQELRKLQHTEAAMPVQDYALQDFEGREVRLSEAFGDHDQLVLIHNMGFHCTYCTMWADGFNAVYPYIQRRAAYLLVSNDAPEKQKLGAAKRGWTQPMLSCAGTTLFADLGFAGTLEGGQAGWWPGFSTLVRHSDGSLSRHSRGFFGPGDDYCSPWRFFEHLAVNDESVEVAP